MRRPAAGGARALTVAVATRRPPARTGAVQYARDGYDAGAVAYRAAA